MFTECPGCGVGLQATNQTCTLNCGFLTSPNFPMQYANEVTTTWYIDLEFGFYVKLVFTQMNVQSQLPDCKEDSVEVYDIITNIKTNLLGRFCIANKPESAIFSSWNNMRIVMMADAAYTDTGFYAEYQGVTVHISEDLKAQLNFEGNLYQFTNNNNDGDYDEGNGVDDDDNDNDDNNDDNGDNNNINDGGGDGDNDADNNENNNSNDDDDNVMVMMMTMMTTLMVTMMITMIAMMMMIW